MDELIKKLSMATGPDRQLDRMIEETLHVGHVKVEYNGTNWTVVAPHYTKSIDDALRLVPSGWGWRVMQNGPYATGLESKPRAELAEPIETEFGPGVGIRAQVEAATPAIALCVASLNARLNIHKDRG